MSEVPNSHDGLGYNFFLAQLSEKRRTKRYLEVGVSKGNVLKDVPSTISVGVDPFFEIEHNVTLGKKIVTLIQATSDEFFASEEMKATLGGSPEMTFLDGLHTFEFLLRDFMHTERFGTDTSLIAMHDCLPLDAVMATRHTGEWAEKTKGSKFEGWWTGDVWKVIPILKEYRPDLKLLFLNCHPTGLVLVTNLDPSSDVLQRNYMQIVDKYSKVENSQQNIAEMYAGIEITDPEVILREFDHTLYLKA